MAVAALLHVIGLLHRIVVAVVVLLWWCCGGGGGCIVVLVLMLAHSCCSCSRAHGVVVLVVVMAVVHCSSCAYSARCCLRQRSAWQCSVCSGKGMVRGVCSGQRPWQAGECSG